MPTGQSPAAEARVVADTLAPIPRTCPFVDIVPASLYYLGYNTTDVMGATGTYFPQIGIIGAMVIVWRARGKIIRCVLCNIVCNSCTQ